MSRTGDDEYDIGARSGETDTRFDLRDAVDMLGRRLGGALVLAGALIGFGAYAGGGGDEAATYQAFAADGEVFRVNTDNGTVIACNAERCMRILERGQDLAEDQGNSLFRVRIGPQEPRAQPPAAQAPVAQPQQALPPPAAPSPAQPEQRPPG